MKTLIDIAGTTLGILLILFLGIFSIASILLTSREEEEDGIMDKKSR